MVTSLDIAGQKNLSLGLWVYLLSNDQHIMTFLKGSVVNINAPQYLYNVYIVYSK